jgi:hypothetical protein
VRRILEHDIDAWMTRRSEHQDIHNLDDLHSMPCSTTVPDISLCAVQNQKIKKSFLEIVPDIIFVCILEHGDGARFVVFCTLHAAGAISEVEFGP